MLVRNFSTADIVDYNDPPPPANDARWQLLTTTYVGGGATLIVPRGCDDRSDPAGYPTSSFQVLMDCVIDGVRQVHVLTGAPAYGSGETGHHGINHSAVQLHLIDPGTDVRVCARAVHPLMASSIDVDLFISVLKLPEETE